MKKQIIIDTVSSTYAMCDPAYCDKIEKSEKEINLATNGIVMHSGMKCEADKLRDAWFNKDSLTNILNFTNLGNKLRNKYDSNI